MSGRLPGLVFSDLDESFLATDKSVPEANMRALDLMARLGVGFVPCTGRAATAVPRMLREHPATRCVIASNGAVVADGRCKTIRARLMRATDVLELYRRTSHLDVTFDVFLDGNVWSERPRYEAMGSFGLAPETLQMLREVRRPMDQTVPELLADLPDVEKVTSYYGDQAQCDAFVREVSELPALGYTSSHVTNVEVMAAGVSKGEALAWVCGWLGVDVARTVAFGDSPNDVTMLDEAGDGVAMVGSSPEVIARADHVCPGNNEGGVGRYLLELLGGA